MKALMNEQTNVNTFALKIYTKYLLFCGFIHEYPTYIHTYIHMCHNEMYLVLKINNNTYLNAKHE